MHIRGSVSKRVKEYGFRVLWQAMRLLTQAKGKMGALGRLLDGLGNFHTTRKKRIEYDYNSFVGDR